LTVYQASPDLYRIVAINGKRLTGLTNKINLAHMSDAAMQDGLARFRDNASSIASAGGMGPVSFDELNPCAPR
jgi:hypothetical protein